MLTRTKDFGRELLHAAEAHGVAMAYEGGIELFIADQMKLVLAWLRILEGDGERGWAVVLERAGYTQDEMAHVLERGAYPDDVAAFRDALGRLESVGAVAETVLARYGYDGTYADAVVETLQDAFDSTTMTRGDLVRFVERGIEEGTTRDVTAPAGADAVTVQTIHAAKGLEYPIVVLANMNRYTFPPSGGGSPVISFDEPVGLRQRKVYADEHGWPHVYDSWRTDVLRACLPTEYDEERRLLYVAMTRAEQHLVFTAGEEPNAFLEALPVEVETVEPDVREWEGGGTVQTTLDASVPLPEGPVGWNPHELMSDEVFAETDEGKGTEFGTRVHEFAESYARGEDVAVPGVGEPDGDEPDWANVVELIDSLDGELFVEQEAVLPLDVNGETVAISGVVDLVCVGEDTVEVIDFKTDRDRRAGEEYRKQLSVYYRVVEAWFADRAVSASLYFTHVGSREAIEPYSREEIGAMLPETGR